MSILVLLLSAAASGFQPAAAMPVLDGSTAKSVATFERCFMSTQEAQARPLWLVAHEDGVRISNEGAAGVANPYRIRFTEGQGRNRVQVTMARRDDAEERPLVEAVKGCW